MKMEMEFVGLEEIIQAFNQAASEDEIREVDKRIVTKALDFVHKTMKQKIPVSSDNSMSGRGLKGGGESRPKHGHAKENIPIIKARKSAKGAVGSVGWEIDDNSEYFYMKFVNWGTIYVPPRDFVDSTKNETDEQMSRIAEDEYQNFLKKLR